MAVNYPGQVYTVKYGLGLTVNYPRLSFTLKHGSDFTVNYRRQSYTVKYGSELSYTELFDEAWLIIGCTFS